ncbi:MAG: MogA/MoaB family molybdenum cofactor biosynthesis protein [Promethearchaeota archaeon]
MTELPDTVKEHKKHDVKDIHFALLIISTSRYNENVNGTASSDRTGEIVMDMMATAGYSVVKTEFVPDSRELIQERVERALENPRVDAIITSGGTGISPKDQTIASIESLNVSPLPGFGELFRQLSFNEIGTASILSRSEAYTAGRKCIFCLPGSPRAVKLGLEQIIIKEIGHVLSQLRKEE